MNLWGICWGIWITKGLIINVNIESWNLFKSTWTFCVAGFSKPSLTSHNWGTGLLWSLQRYYKPQNHQILMLNFFSYWKNHFFLSGLWFCSNKYDFPFKLICLHWLKQTDFCLLSTFNDPLKLYTPVIMNILYYS